MKEKDVSKKTDEFEKDYGYISRHHADDQGKPGNRQHTPGCGEVSESLDWNGKMGCGCGLYCWIGFVHGPAFLVPPVRSLGTTVFSFTWRPSAVSRWIASTKMGPESRSSCRAATPSLRRSKSPSGVIESVTCLRSVAERVRR